MSTLPTGSLVVAYLRASGVKGQELSIPQQKQEIGRFCKEHGWILVRLFSDFSTGGSTAGRDQFLEMFDYLERTPSAGVIFWAYSRFARDYDDTQFYLADLRRRGITVLSMTDPVPDTLDGRLMESITAWKDEKYRLDLGRDIRRAKKYMITVLKAWPGGYPPVGYALQRIASGPDREITKLVPDPDLAPIVQRAFEMRAQGATLSEIKNATNLTGSIPATGKLLRKPIYKGEYHYNGQVVADYCQPLVDAETWDKAIGVGDKRRQKWGYDHPRTIRSEYWLTGSIFCTCGKSMHGRSTSNKHKGYGGKMFYYYRCQTQNEAGPHCGARMIPKVELETAVINDITAYLRSDIISDAYDQSLAAHNRRRQEVDADINLAQSAQAAIQAQIDRIIAAIAATGHSAALLKQLEELEANKVDLELRVAELQAAKAARKSDYTKAELVARALEMADELDQKSRPEEKAVILANTIKKIVASRDDQGDITIQLQYKDLI
jgi:site-specific DNA recombinase